MAEQSKRLVWREWLRRYERSEFTVAGFRQRERVRAFNPSRRLIQSPREGRLERPSRSAAQFNGILSVIAARRRDKTLFVFWIELASSVKVLAAPDV